MFLAKRLKESSQNQEVTHMGQPAGQTSPPRSAASQETVELVGRIVRASEEGEEVDTTDEKGGEDWFLFCRRVRSGEGLEAGFGEV